MQESSQTVSDPIPQGVEAPMQWSPNAESVYKIYEDVCIFALSILLQTIAILRFKPPRLQRMGKGKGGLRGDGDQGL